MNTVKAPVLKDDLLVIDISAGNNQILSIMVTYMVDGKQEATTDITKAAWFMGYSEDEKAWVEVDVTRGYYQGITWH